MDPILKTTHASIDLRCTFSAMKLDVQFNKVVNKLNEKWKLHQEKYIKNECTNCK